LLRDLIQVTEHAVAKKEITFRQQVSDLPDIDCDPNQLRQVLLNLLINLKTAVDSGFVV